MSDPVNILLVVNSAEAGEQLIDPLQREDFELAWKRVETGDSLKLALASQHWDLVLMDDQVSGFAAETGLEIVGTWDPKLPVIIVSSAMGEESALDFIRAGARDFVLRQNLARLPAAVEREVRRNNISKISRPQSRALAESGNGLMTAARGRLAMSDDISERTAIEGKEDRAIRQLRQRVEELTALHHAAMCLRRASLSLDEVLQEFLGILSQAFQHPELAGARIRFDHQEKRTQGFWESPWSLSSGFELLDGRRGVLEVLFSEEPMAGLEGRFRREGQQLLDSLAEMLGNYLDRQEAEELLLASEQRHRLLIETIPHMVWTAERDGRTNYINRRAEMQLGVPAEGIVNGNWLDYVHPEDRDHAYEIWKVSVATGGDYRNEYRIRVADGSYRWYLAQAMPLARMRGEVERWIGTWTDINDMKMSEAGLKRTSDLLKAVANSTTDAIFVKDQQGRYLLFNPAAARFVGLSVEEVLGQDDKALFSPDEARFVMEQDRRVMETGQVEIREECLTAAGVTRTYLATRAPYRDAEGKIIGVIGILHDLTERKKAEDALRLSEERFRAFMDNSPACAWITDLEGRCLYASASYCQMIGVEASHFTGRRISEFFPKEYADIYLRNNQIVAETGKVLEVIEPRIRADGTTGEFLVYKFPVGNSEGMLSVGGVGVDITDRREMAESLRIRDRAIGAATQGIIITDTLKPDHPIIYVSPGFERLTGYSSSELLGKNCRLLQGPGTDPHAKARLRQAIEAGESCTLEILNYRKDGTPFWNQLSISPVRDAEGQLINFVGVQNDVTERHQLENQIQQSQKMEAIGQLAGGIAHDFNNLLTIINGYAGQLLEQTAPDDPNWEPLNEICKAGERSAALTRQLLAFSRRQVLMLEILDLNAVVIRAETMLRRLIGENIELTTLPSPGRLPVKSDAGQIEQLLLNLAVNARDAMPRGGKLTIETQKVELNEEYGRIHPDVPAGPFAMLSVSDNGCGMTPEVQSRIFEPFFTTKKEEGGTGLGLPVVHGIVKQSGGHLEVSSEIGLGTTFKILLPRHLRENDLPPRVDDQEGRGEHLPRGNETILLVEDESGVRRFAKQILENCGYIVLEASDGTDATRLLETYTGMFTLPIHLLVTDIVMPDESGPQIAERMRKNHPEMRVIFISGYTDDTVLRHGIRNSEVNFLQKPFTSFELARKVRAVLDKT